MALTHWPKTDKKHHFQMYGVLVGYHGKTRTIVTASGKNDVKKDNANVTQSSKYTPASYRGSLVCTAVRESKTPGLGLASQAILACALFESDFPGDHDPYSNLTSHGTKTKCLPCALAAGKFTGVAGA